MTDFQFDALNILSNTIPLDKFRELHDCVELNKLIRFEIFLKDIFRIPEWASKLGLSFSISDKSFQTVVDKGMDNWASSICYCSDDNIDVMRFVYLHSTKEVCERAKQYEENENDLELGLLLSYPKCCVEGYLKWQREKEDIDPITTIVDSFQFTGKLNNYNFPNPFSRYFGSGLFSHFPCSLNCAETITGANQSFKTLQANFPITANKILKFENALTIFHKEIGVGLWTKFDLFEHYIYVDKTTFHGQGEFKSIFKTIDEISLTKSQLTLFAANKQISQIPNNGLLFATFLRLN